MRSCMNRVTHVHTHMYRHKTYFLSRQWADCVTWHDRPYAHAQMDRGGADSCAFGRGGAESVTFDLKIDN